MHRNAYLLLLLTMLFWAGNAVAGKFAVGHVSPMLLTTMRWGLALVILVPLASGQFRAEWRTVHPRLVYLSTLGAIGFSVFNALMYSALTFTSAINISIEQAGLPMVIFLINFLLFSLRVSWAQMLGLVLSVAGIALTASHGEIARLAALDVNSGDGLMMIALVLYGAYTVALRYKPALSWQSLMLVLCASAFLMSIPFAVWEVVTDRATWPDAYGWAIGIFTAVFPSVLAQAFYIRSVELIGSNRAGLFVNLVPIFGTVLAIVFLGEAFHLYHALAIVLVLGGIWIAEHSGRKMARGAG